MKSITIAIAIYTVIVAVLLLHGISVYMCAASLPVLLTVIAVNIILDIKKPKDADAYGWFLLLPLLGIVTMLLLAYRLDGSTILSLVNILIVLSAIFVSVYKAFEIKKSIQEKENQITGVSSY